MNEQNNPKPRQNFAFDVLYFVAAMFAVLLIRDLLVGIDHVSEIPYSEFRQRLDKGELTDLVVGPTRVTGSLPTEGKDQPQHFTTVRVDPQLADDLTKRGISFSGQPEPGLFENFISWLLPMAGFIVLWMFILRPMAMGHGGMMGMGKSKAKIYAETDVGVKFADVAGVDEAKGELAEVVGFLRDPKSFGRLGARVPKGVLLVGPPGTGKTLLARAVAGEAGVPFFSITGSEFVEMYVGVGAARVRDLFEQARAQAPAILFIDELDALGRARGVGVPGGGHEEKEQTLNQLLAEMDGFDARSGIIVLSATNRPEILDPALLRAGRFARQVLVDRPDRKGRASIVRVHLQKIMVDPNLDVDAIAALTPGFTGADIANLVNEAALAATRRGANTTELADFNQAVERIVIGIEKKGRILGPKEREIVAHHEMGHALVAMTLPGSDPVQKISIISRGLGALGYTLQRPTSDRYLMSLTDLTNQMAVLLGGRAAECLVFNEVSTGAADDLVRATDIARNMVTRFGMVRELGHVAYETEAATFLSGQVPSWKPRSYGDGTAEAIDRAIQKLIEEAFVRAKDILSRNKQTLIKRSMELLEKETMDQDELTSISAEILQKGGEQSRSEKGEGKAA